MQKELEALRDAAKTGDVAKVQDIGRKADQVDNEANGLARKLGATTCTQR